MYFLGSDFVKFGFTMAFATTILSWGVIKYKDAYQAAGMIYYYYKYLTKIVTVSFECYSFAPLLTYLQ